MKSVSFETDEVCVLSQPVVSSVGCVDQPSAKTKVKVAVLNKEERRDVEKCLSTVFASMRIMPYAAPCRMRTATPSASEVTSEFVNDHSSCGLPLRHWSCTVSVVVGQIAGHAFGQPQLEDTSPIQALRREINSPAHALPQRQSPPTEAKNCRVDMYNGLFCLRISSLERPNRQSEFSVSVNPKTTVIVDRFCYRVKRDVTTPYIDFRRYTMLLTATKVFVDTATLHDEQCPVERREQPVVCHASVCRRNEVMVRPQKFRFLVLHGTLNIEFKPVRKGNRRLYAMYSFMLDDERPVSTKFRSMQRHYYQPCEEGEMSMKETNRVITSNGWNPLFNVSRAEVLMNFQNDRRQAGLS